MMMKMNFDFDFVIVVELKYKIFLELVRQQEFVDHVDHD
jgi:hypothetical protein